MSGPYIRLGETPVEEPQQPGLMNIGRVMRLDLMQPASQLPPEQQVVVPPAQGVPMLSQIGAMNSGGAVPAEPMTFEQQTMKTLEQSAPPGAQARRANEPDVQKRPTAQRGGIGNWRDIFKREMDSRTAQRDAAAQELGSANERFQKANDELVGVQQAGLEAEARGADTLANAHAATQQRVDQLTALDMQKRQAEDGARAQKDQEISAGWEEYSRATIEDRRTPGERTVATFGVALAGIADALLAYTGQEARFQKQTMDGIKQQIEADAQKQIEALGRKREGLTAREVALQRFVNQVGDDRAARDLLVRKQWEDMAHLADQVAARTQNELKKNAATELGAQARQQAAAADVAGRSAAAETAASRVQQLGDLGFELSLKGAMGQGKPKNTPAAYGLRQLAEGTPEDAKKAQEVASGSAGILDNIAQLKAMAAKGATLSKTERNIARRRVLSLKSQFNGVFGDGTAPNEAQLEALDEAFANPTEANLSNVQREYDVLEQDARSQTNAKMRPYGWALDSVDVRPE